MASAEGCTQSREVASDEQVAAAKLKEIEESRIEVMVLKLKALNDVRFTDASIFAINCQCCVSPVKCTHIAMSRVPNTRYHNPCAFFCESHMQIVKDRLEALTNEV
jgi:hypothetical protein